MIISDGTYMAVFARMQLDPLALICTKRSFIQKQAFIDQQVIKTEKITARTAFQSAASAGQPRRLSIISSRHHLATAPQNDLQ